MVRRKKIKHQCIAIKHENSLGEEKRCTATARYGDYCGNHDPERFERWAKAAKERGGEEYFDCQCTAICNSGFRCSRDRWNGYEMCKQHVRCAQTVILGGFRVESIKRNVRSYSERNNV